MKNEKVLEMLTGQEEEKRVTTTAFMVEMTAFDYNDEYYSSTEFGTCHGNTIYLRREKAEEDAHEYNLQHAREVVTDMGPWGYGDTWVAQVEHESQEDLTRLFKILQPDEAAPTDEKALIDELMKIEGASDVVSDEDLDWLVKTFSFFRYAYVAEVQIDGSL